MAEAEARPDEAADRRAARRRLDEIFGEVLPSQTRDDVDTATSGRTEQWYRDQRPPHHGGK